MSLKKLLGIISVVIVVMFALMLTTSYAWYSFEEGRTEFSAVTNNDDIIVSYQKGEYINTSIAVPISDTEVDKYSEKNNFTVRVKDSSDDNEIAVTISLVEISIDGALQNENFKVELYHQNSNVASIAGNAIGTSGATTKKLSTVTLDDDVDNNFELRLYILDNDADQSSMMNKSFQAKIKIEVVSRLKTTLNDWSNPDIYISSITVDGTATNNLPTSGYYSMSATCEKGSTLSWEPLSKTITYESGSYVNDSCALTFTSSTDYPLLSEMEPGSYVKYVGANGCDGKACEGQNANYVSDMDMGYCYESDYKFTVNGWRIAYIKNGSAYLVSAGAPECLATYVEQKSTSTSTQTLSYNYYYGSGYSFNSSTGKYTLTGVTSSTLEWSSNYESIIADTPYTCGSSYSSTCLVMYEVVSYSSSTKGEAYLYYYYSGNPSNDHIPHLNQAALTYCNPKYAKGGVCDNETAWAMNANDFESIVGSALSSSSCYKKYSDKACGYTNDLIDNGGDYWFATAYSSSSVNSFNWSPYGRDVFSDHSGWTLGVRPVLYLESNVLVIGGAGTYEDPYEISIES